MLTRRRAIVPAVQAARINRHRSSDPVMIDIESRLEDVAYRLDLALRQVEQRCQEMRWRLAHFGVGEAAPGGESEVGDLIGEAAQVARLYGEMSVLSLLDRATERIGADAEGQGWRVEPDAQGDHDTVERNRGRITGGEL